MILLGIIGQKLSGKGMAVQFLTAQHRAVSLAGGHIIADILAILKLSTTRANITRLAIALRDLFGDNVINHAIITQLTTLNPPIGIIDGIRLDSELEQAREFGAKIIYIAASDAVRYQRYLSRREKPDDGSLNFADFLKEDMESTNEKQIRQLSEKADFHVSNDSTPAKLYGQLAEIIRQL